MLSICAVMEDEEHQDVDGPKPEDVMRYYFTERVRVLKRARAAELLGIETPQGVDYIKSGRNDIKGKHLSAVAGERTAADLFGVLADLARQAARGEIRVEPDDAVAVGKQKQATSGGPPRDPKATGGVARKARRAKRSPGKPRQQSPSPDPSAPDR